MDVGYFFIGDTGLYVAQHLAYELANTHFISMHKTAQKEDCYRQLLALPSRLSSIELRFTNQYYDNIPDYIESTRGSALFCTTEDTQFGSLNASNCEKRIWQYEHIISNMFAPYDRLVFVMRPGQITGELGIQACLCIAKRCHKEALIVTTCGLAFEERMKTTTDVHLRMLKQLEVPLKVVEVPIRMDRILDTYNDLYAAMAKQVCSLYQKSM